MFGFRVGSVDLESGAILGNSHKDVLCCDQFGVNAGFGARPAGVVVVG